MKLISTKDRRIVKYVHLNKSIEGLSYTLKPYPQSSYSKPNLTDWQIECLMESLEWDAKRLGLIVRHS